MNSAERLHKLEPYIEYDYLKYKNVPLEVCPIGEAYENIPKKYEWNEIYSGKSINDFSDQTFIKDEFPIKCPYHNSPAFQAYYKLLEYAESRD